MTTQLAPPPSGASPTLQAYDQYVDGLFTYCLSVLCEHDAAVDAVREVRDLASRHGTRLAEPGLLRAWLYSLARHCCLRRLERGGEPPADPLRAGLRRDELASLAWPEAAGTDPEQREALELSVRHRLAPTEVAAVLGLSTEATESLLSSAGAEVGRTRAALLVLGVGSCPVLAQLGGVGAESWRGWVLGPALRRELVQHVVECPTCRGTSGRVADELDSGLEGLPGLPVLPAPANLRAGAAPAGPACGSAGAAFLAGAAAGRRAALGGHGPADPADPAELRFDQRGFPRHRAPGQGRARVRAVRQRVVTTGVLAAVLTAPVVALWVAHRNGGSPAAPVSAVRVGPASPESVGPTPANTPDPVTNGLELAAAVAAETLLPPVQGTALPVPPRGTGASLSPPASVDPAPSAGLLTVEANEYGNRTVITMTNSGGTAIQWHAVVDVDWLRLSRDSGTLEPGQRITVTVTVDDARAPQTHWTARIALPPSEAVVTLEGGPQHRGGGGTGSPTPNPTPTPGPSDAPTPSPSPSDPAGSPAPGPSGTPTHSPGPTSSPSPTPTASTATP